MTTAADTPATDAPRSPTWVGPDLTAHRPEHDHHRRQRGQRPAAGHGRRPRLTQTDAQWVNSIYSLLFASLLITVGLLADKFGRRLLFLVGIAVFLVRSLASGSANSPEFLIAARAVQAIGASMMLPSSIAVINVLFMKAASGHRLRHVGAVFGGAAGLGPLPRRLAG